MALELKMLTFTLLVWRLATSLIFKAEDFSKTVFYFQPEIEIDMAVNTGFSMIHIMIQSRNAVSEMSEKSQHFTHPNPLILGSIPVSRTNEKSKRSAEKSALLLFHLVVEL